MPCLLKNCWAASASPPKHACCLFPLSLLPCSMQELFLQELAVRAHAAMAADSSRKGLEYKDIGAFNCVDS